MDVKGHMRAHGGQLALVLLMGSVYMFVQNSTLTSTALYIMAVYTTLSSSI